MRGLTENNVCLVWAVSERVAGPWQLVAWYIAFWVGGPIRVQNRFSFYLCSPAWSGPSPRWILAEEEPLAWRGTSIPHYPWLSNTRPRGLDAHSGGECTYSVIIHEVPSPPLGPAQTSVKGWLSLVYFHCSPSWPVSIQVRAFPRTMSVTQCVSPTQCVPLR